jgi:HD-GYP domain-containing protein (c-di-GMP phosphodiesterase class II)
MQEFINEDNGIVLHKERLNLRNSISGKVSSLEQLQPLITAIMRIIQHALNASASSLLLCGEENQTLSFMFADGPLGGPISRLRVSKQTGIAGWVARNGKPLIVNDVNGNKYFNKYLDEVTGYTTKSIICAPVGTHDKVIGVIELLNKLDGADFSENDLQTLMTAAATITQVIEYFKQPLMSLSLHKIIIKALLSAVDVRETCMRGHSRRVSEYALMGATALSLSNEEMYIIEYAAILHDIGKLGFPDSLLGKSDTLTNEERGMIRNHPIIGFNLLGGIAFLQVASKLVLYHHERYDGKGYPEGLKEHSIPIGARLIAVADTFDNMTTGQSNRPALSKKDAFIELRGYVGSKFDLAAAKAFYSGYIKSLSPDKILHS